MEKTDRFRFPGAACGALVVISSLCVALLPVSVVNAETVYFDLDFDEAPLGEWWEPPPGVDAIQSGLDTRVMVVDATTDPVDPMGPEGNRSLMIENNDSGGQSRVTISQGFPEEGITAGTLSMRVYPFVDETYNRPFLRIWGMHENVNNRGISVGIQTNLDLRIGGANVRTISGLFQANEVHDVKIVFAANSFLSIYVNNELVVDPDDGESVFPMEFSGNYTPETPMNGLQVGAPWTGLTGCLIFVDDIRLTSDAGIFTPSVPAEMSRFSAIELEYATDAATTALYQLQASSDLQNWENLGAAVTGSGQSVSRLLSIQERNRQFYRVLRTE